ncbi:hypothetical protein D3C71_1735780 [compost metagenome]
MILLRSRDLHGMPHLGLVHRVGHCGLLGKTLCGGGNVGCKQRGIASERLAKRMGPLATPGPTQYKGHQYRLSDAAPAPPLRLLLPAVRSAQCSGDQRVRHRGLE